MTTTATDLRAHEPFDRHTASELGRVEYRKLVDELRRLAPDEWSLDTDCDGWTVRDLIGHVGGMMMTYTSLRNVAREQMVVKRRVKQTGEDEIDAMTATQVAKVASLSADELVAEMDRIVDAAVAGRRRLPAFIATRATIPVLVGAVTEKWTMEYLLGTILTRDTWLHRVSDLARAVGRDPVLDPAHDGAIVADVAAEWARRHGRAVHLELTGAAGGRFVAGSGGPSITVDAFDFCRMLSGRAEPTHELLSTEVPF